MSSRRILLYGSDKTIEFAEDTRDIDSTEIRVPDEGTVVEVEARDFLIAFFV